MSLWLIIRSSLFYEYTPIVSYFWIAPFHQDVKHVGGPSEGKGQA